MSQSEVRIKIHLIVYNRLRYNSISYWRLAFVLENAMIHARIHQGRIELQDPIPDEWEGHVVKILPMTPDDPMPGLEEWLTELHAMGPMEFDPGERELMIDTLAELDRISKAAMQRIAGIQT